jgi:Carboxypeptidase regulatory-like domain
MMRVPAATLAILALVATCSSASGQTATGRGTVRLAVTDSSGGALPGTTVVATLANGQLLGTQLTDGSGRASFIALPAGVISLTFQLEGFAEAAVALTVEPGVELRVVQRLELASLSETVVVRAPAAVDRPLARFDPLPAPPLVTTPLPEHDRGAVCGPAKPDPFPEPLGTIRSRRHEIQGALYLSDAELVIDGGLQDGLLVGRNLVVRRYYHVRDMSNADLLAEHSAGVVQIVAADEHSSVAVVMYVCDELRKGDFLASFKPESIRNPDPVGTPAFYDAARILFADEGQSLARPPRRMVIDRGSDHDVRVGQRFTLFHQHGRGGRRTVGGEAVVVGVRSDSATIRIDQITDAIMAGDWAAPQSTTSAHREQR